MQRSMQDMHAPKLEGRRIFREKIWKDIIDILLVLNNDNYGTWYLSSLPYQGSFIIDKTHIQYG